MPFNFDYSNWDRFLDMNPECDIRNHKNMKPMKPKKLTTQSFLECILNPDCDYVHALIITQQFLKQIKNDIHLHKEEAKIPTASNLENPQSIIRTNFVDMVFGTYIK